MAPCSAGAWHPSTERTPLNLSLPSFSLNPILPWACGGIFFLHDAEEKWKKWPAMV